MIHARDWSNEMSWNIDGKSEEENHILTKSEEENHIPH
jgi:hypothetical protein